MRIFKKIYKFIIVALISIVAIALSILGLYYLFTGGIQAIEQGIKNDGLWNFIIRFGKEFWHGLKNALGF